VERGQTGNNTEPEREIVKEKQNLLGEERSGIGENKTMKGLLRV